MPVRSSRSLVFYTFGLLYCSIGFYKVHRMSFVLDRLSIDTMLDSDGQTVGHGKSKRWMVRWLLVGLHQLECESLNQHGHDGDSFDRRELLS